MKIKRRSFLKTAGVFGAGVLTYNPVLGAFSKVSEDAKRLKADIGNWYPTTCQGCTTWCPVEVLIQDGRAVKVRGNQNSMTNPGNCCPKGHMMPKQIYDPDRLKVPMKRTNPEKGKGIDPQFVPISWDEALGTIADKMLELRDNGESHKFVYLRGRYSYHRDIIYSALPKIFGSPNGISHSSVCAEAEKAGAYWTEGYWDYRDYDLDNTKYLVLWGVDPFRSNRQIPTAIAKWPTIKENATVVTIDPTFTTAAAKSNDWLAVKPGEDGALATAMAHHILVNGLWHREFVGDFNGNGASAFVADTDVDENDFTEVQTNGLVKWWNIELKDKTPAWAAGLTGISQAKIEEIAEGMAAQAPSVAVWYGPGPCMSPRGTYTAMAIYALNGLLGSIGNVGGVLRKASSPSSNGIPAYADYQDDIAKAGAGHKKIDQRGYLEMPAIKKKSGKGVVTNNVPNAMLASDPYDVKVVIGNWCNFIYSGAQPQRWRDAFAALPFFAHITTNASEMTQYADIVLPAAFPSTEKWAHLKTASNKYSEITIQRPLSTRLFDVRGDENEIPFMLSEVFKAKGFPNLHDYYSTTFVDPDTGATPTNPAEFAEIAEKLFTQPSYSKLDGGWDEFVAKGILTNGPQTLKSKWDGGFGTATGNFEFYSETLKEALEYHANKYETDVDAVLALCNYEASGELAFVPHYETPLRWGDVETYPLDFIDIKSRFNREGRSQNVGWYYQFKKLDPGDRNWEDTVSIHPSDAAAYGIADGDAVIVSSPTGSLMSTARLWEGVRPGCLAKTYGGGHWAYGRFASDYANLTETGGNNNEVLPDDYDRLSGSTARNGGFVGVKIEKA
jgi:anaerobic selenocysteine-containing dehydrogenase